MAIARSGVYIDDYFEDARTLPAELQRLLNTIRELDDRSQAMIKETGQQTKYWGLRKGSNSQAQGGYGHEHDNEEEESASEKLQKEIEANQDNALSLCTEKVLLAKQAYDLCQGGEWFHYSCLGLTPETRFKGKWYCPACRLLRHGQ